MPPDKPRHSTFKIAALLLLAALAATIIYADYRAARLVSGALSSYLGLPVRVALIDAGPAAGVTLGAITVDNPPGYTQPRLARIKSINIQPDYKALISGVVSVKSVRINGPEIFVERDGGGKWNLAAALESYRAGRKEPAKPAREFSVGLVELTGGRVYLPAKGLEFRLRGAGLTGLSNREGSRATFYVEADDARAARIEASGSAVPFSAEPEIRARLTVTVSRIGPYLDGPVSETLKGASCDATVELAASGKTAEASVEGRLSNVMPGTDPKDKGRQADFNARLSYDRTADAILIESAGIRVPEYADVGIKGNITDISGRMVGKICADMPDIDLAVLKPYMPPGFNVSGRAGIDDVCLEGPLRPFEAEARGRLVVNGLSAGYDGKGFSGAFGGAAVKYEKGRLSGRYDFRLMGGGVTGGFGYDKNGGRFRASAIKLKLSSLEGLPKDLTGTVDSDIEGEVGPGLKSIRASGALTATEIAFRGRKGGKLSCSYSYDGKRAELEGLRYEDEGLFAGMERLTASFSGNRVEAKAGGGEAVYGDGLVRLVGLEAELDVSRAEDGKVISLDCEFGMRGGEVYGLPLTGAAGNAAYDGGSAAAKIGLKISGNPVSIAATAEIDSSGLKKHRLSGNLDVEDLAGLAPAFERAGLAVSPTAGALSSGFEIRGEGGDWSGGGGSVKLSGLSAGSAERTLLSGVSAELFPVYENGRLTLPRAWVDFGGYFKLDVSASAEHTAEGWSAKADAALPMTPLSALQEGVLEALPPKLMWADVSGEAGAEIGAAWSRSGGASVEGVFELAGAGLELPDIGLSIGPAYGRLPVGLYFGGGGGRPAPSVFRGEVFDRERYPELARSYSAVPDDASIVIDRIRYGFVELESVTLALTPGEGYYDIDWLGLYAFKGRLTGYGRADLSGGRHALSLIMSDFSLTELCDTVPAIKGYLSGRVDGLARLVVEGKGYEGVTGAAKFWAKDGEGDEREISREFIKKLMGSSMKKYMSLFVGDRYFDTGEMEIVFSKGDLVFEKLLIENTNFLGQRDLHITVAPVSNRITIEHLLEVIRDVKARAGGNPAPR